MKYLLLIYLMLLAGPYAYGAEKSLPENGFKAEQEGRWEDAVSAYHEALLIDQQQLEIWLRLADIHSHLKQHDKTAYDLEHATNLRPDDAALWKKLSEARAMATDKNGALLAVNRAVELSPDNLDFLRAQAQLAVWANNYSAAITSYRKINLLAPQDISTRLWLARVNSWMGRTDSSVKEYHAYLEHQPEDKDVWLELIKIEGWRGDYPAALDDLAYYSKHFGMDRSYLELQARALAWMGKSASAIEIAQGLLVETPNDPEVLTTRLIALNQANRIDEALADLKTIESIQPNSKETKSLQRYLLTPLRSSMSIGSNYSSDSSELHIVPVTLDGEIVMNQQTRMIAGIERQFLNARIGSGLENIGGSEGANFSRAWGGLKHRFSPTVASELRLGIANAEGNNRSTEFRGAFDWRPSDDWVLRSEVERALYSVSPRAISLNVKRDSFRLNAHWTPMIRNVIDSVMNYDRYSDGNTRWEAILAPRRAILRTQRFNMDIGLNGTWSRFNKNLNNGYYDPSHFQHYAVTNFLYWKLNEDNGISLALSLGAQKDDSMSAFKIGGDAVAQGNFGINSDWDLRVFGSLIHNKLGVSGAYRNNNIGFVLTRRF